MQRTTEDRRGNQIKFVLWRDLSGLYNTTLLGGEFSNCHGQGNTPEGAVTSLKIKVYQLRDKL